MQSHEQLLQSVELTVRKESWSLSKMQSTGMHTAWCWTAQCLQQHQASHDEEACRFDTVQ